MYVFVLCACVCLCVHELGCVRVCLGVCYFGVCLLVCVEEARQYPCSLGNKPFEIRDHVPYVYDVEHCHICDLTIVWENACQSKTSQPSVLRSCRGNFETNLRILTLREN